MEHRSLGLLMAVLAAALIGCAASAPPAPTPIGGMVTADGAVNPDGTGRASPVTVKIYQLRTAGSFESGDFFALYGNAASVLGPDLISSQDLMIRPGESKRFAEEIDPRTRFVGVVAAFRDIQNAQWRAVVSVPAEDLEHRVLEVRLSSLAAAASFVDAN